MGEEFLRRQREIVQRHLATADAVITTALVPGRPAPRLVTAEMVRAMRAGSVIVDLAVEQGGNCELSQADREVVENGVLILGPSNLPAAMPHDASLLYARNVFALLQSSWTRKGTWRSTSRTRSSPARSSPTAAWSTSPPPSGWPAGERPG